MLCKDFCEYICCSDRKPIVTTATINSLFLVTAFPNFTCDIPFSVSDMNV